MDAIKPGSLADYRKAGALLIFAILVLYLFTMPSGLLWGGGDFASYQRFAYVGTIDEPPSVFSHYLWVYVTYPIVHLLPFNDPAWRANFATSLYALGALWFVYLAAFRVTRSLSGAVAGTLALAISHTFWTYAVMPKVYSLNCFILALCIYLLLVWRDRRGPFWLALTFFLYGLSFSNHIVMAVNGAGLAGFVWLASDDRGIVTSRRLRAALWSLGGLLIGILAFALFLAKTADAAPEAAAASSRGVLETMWQFLFALPGQFFDPAAWAEGGGWAIMLGGYQFFFAALLGCLGAVWLWRRDRAITWLVLLSILGTFLFLLAATDNAVGGPYIWNLHYYLQAYVPFALFIAAGATAVLDRLAAVRPPTRALAGRVGLFGVVLLTPILVYWAAPMVAREYSANIPEFRPLPGRDNLVYVLSPWKQGEDGARPFGEAILTALPPNATLFADYSIWAVVRYLIDVENQRPDVRLVRLTGDQVELIRSLDNGDELYLADTYRYYNLPGIEQYYEVRNTGPIYKLERR